MLLLSCPECERALEIAGLKPGDSLTCSCGHTLLVPRPKSRRSPWWHYVLAGVLVLVVGALASRDFSYNPQRYQGECRHNLKQWYLGQRVLFQEKEFFSRSKKLSSFFPERCNRYAYFSGPGLLEDRSHEQATGSEQAEGVGVDSHCRPLADLSFRQLPMNVALRLGVSGRCPECNVMLACMGQLDDDETLDVWTISTAGRKAPDGSSIAPGELFHDVNDRDE